MGGGEHVDLGPADEPTPLGPDAVPQVPCRDPHVGDQDDRVDDRAPAPSAGRDARWGSAQLGERDTRLARALAQTPYKAPASRPFCGRPAGAAVLSLRGPAVDEVGQG